MGEFEVGFDFRQPLVGRGASFADIDNDGDLDLLIMTTGKKPRLLRNDQQTGHHWVRFQLTSDPKHSHKDLSPVSSHHALGARIQIETQAGIQSRLVMTTRSYLSQTELPVTFGLGNESDIKTVSITWPSGNVSSWDHLDTNRLYQISEQKGLVEK